MIKQYVLEGSSQDRMNGLLSFQVPPQKGDRLSGLWGFLLDLVKGKNVT